MKIKTAMAIGLAVALLTAPVFAFYNPVEGDNSNSR